MLCAAVLIFLLLILGHLLSGRGVNIYLAVSVTLGALDIVLYFVRRYFARRIGRA